MPLKSKPRSTRAGRLEKYRGKRDFKQTSEPNSKIAKREGHSFVVQEHHARAHHFDFRLEMDGVLVSWAVPKGIPEDGAAKRLAVHVEDHPLDYGSFEGVIPKGNYGAGTVAIWDKGVWEPLDGNWRKDYKKGKLKFILKGRRLEGTYLLTKMGEEPNWLMRKIGDVLPIDAKPEHEAAAFVQPQLARVVPSVPAGKEWVHELKLDGYRLIAVQKGGKLTLFTRNGLDWTERFRGIAKEIAALTKKDFVLDGEAVVFDRKGRSGFGDLQAALQAGGRKDIVFVAFDALHFDGLNLRNLPLSKRIEWLARIVSDEAGPVQRSKVWPAEAGAELFKQACKNGLEGIISKNAKGRYVPASRKDWTKSKCRARQEFVVCGYTPPKGSLRGFGALILASFENGKLVPRGKVGTGFSESQRLRLLDVFKPLRAAKPPFPAKEPGAIWLKPKLVAEIEFAEITRDGSIRQGSFIALRDDKAAPDVHLEGLQSATADAKGSKAGGIAISHPERIVYPADGITKMEVAQHYARVGEWMLPYLAKRPLAVIRAPSGITGELFFQKSFPTHIPPHVHQLELDDGTTVFEIRDVNGIVALAQFGVIEFHPWGSLTGNADKPDTLTWDLDPSPELAWNEVLGAALLLRDYLNELGLHPLVKTSGGKGLHLVLQIRRTLSWSVAREFTKAVARAIAEFNPKRFLIVSAKAKRTGKIYIDWMRNGRGQTCIAPWSLRARSGAAVSMPVNWADLRETANAGFTIREPLTPPSDWAHPKIGAITKAMLKKLGVE